VSTLTEEEIGRLLDTVPLERRVQARGALSGSPAALAARIRDMTGGAPQASASADWQAHLSALYMTGFAARHRPPGEVVELYRGLRGYHGRAVVLDSAAARPPADLAEIAETIEPRTAAGFLRRVVSQRQPEDIAAMLSRMPGRLSLRRESARYLCLDEPPQKAAHVALYLRGGGEAAAEPLSRILAIMSGEAREENLAGFLILLDTFGMGDSVRALVAGVVAPAEPGPPEESRDVVNRVATLVRFLLRRREDALARRVVDETIAGFTGSGGQYRLYALVFIFREHGMHEEAQKVAANISGSADGDNVTMVLQFCEEDTEKAAALLEIILGVPQHPLLETAVSFAKKIPLEENRETIFRTIASWPREYHPKFYDGLRRTSFEYAEKFRDAVTDHAGGRKDGADIGHTLMWLLEDEDDKRRWHRATAVLADVVSARLADGGADLNRLADLICTLRDSDGWWIRGPRRELRDEAATLVSEHYEIADLTGLIKAAENRCLPAIVRLVPDWLMHGPRGNTEIVNLFLALREAGASGKERYDAAYWAARSFYRPDIGMSPQAALDRAGLIEEHNGWYEAHHMGIRVPKRPRRPDPDPRPGRPRRDGADPPGSLSVFPDNSNKRHGAVGPGERFKPVTG
jgi:hypothetical protein